MFLFLSKTLPLLVYPLGLAMLLLAAALFLRKYGRWQTVVIVLALLLLWAGSSRWVSFALIRSLEQQYLPKDELPAVDAIVVLGGGTRSADHPRPTAEISEAGDRLIYASWLYHQGKAPHILVTGGGIDWLQPVSNESNEMLELLEMMGVPAEAVWLEPDARNTYENAIYARDILQEKGVEDFLLVTSATHMPRSMRIFQKQGLEPIPAPTDFLVTQADWDFLRTADLRSQLVFALPNDMFLYWTSLALKEYVGTMVYGLRGWL
ncbi:MAG: YdcF family protein [Caldilineales bacterium]|nr:YdcF family protein [Caldilineales bacterium]